MASNGNAQTDQKPPGLWWVFQKRQARKTRETDGGKVYSVSRKLHHAKNKKAKESWARRSWRPKGRRLWPSLVPGTTMLECLIIVAFLS